MYEKTIKSFIVPGIIVFLLLYIFGVIEIPHASKSLFVKESNLQNLTCAEASTPFNQPVQSLPVTGTTVEYYNTHALAPLNITTEPDGFNYLVKVLDWNTKNLVLTAFIRSGETANLIVPFGSFEIKYATGKTWYGYDYLFGPGTSYYRAESRMDFTQSGNSYFGRTIQLMPSTGGNMQISNISENNF